MRFFLGFITSVLLVATLLGQPANAYDPYRTLRGGQLTSANAYSTYDGFTSHASPASANTVRQLEEGEIGVTLGDDNFFGEYVPINGVVDDVEKLLDDANQALGGDVTDLSNRAKALKQDLDSIIDELKDAGNVLTYMLDIQPLSSFAWTSSKVQGTFFLSHQRGGVKFNGDFVPYARALRVSDGNINLTEQCGLDENLNLRNDFFSVADPEKCRVDSSASVDLYAISKFSSTSLSYSRIVYDGDKTVDFERGKLAPAGKIVVGVRANHYEMRANYISFQLGLEENIDIDLNNIANNVQHGGNKISGVDFDLGASYLRPNLAIGITYENINTKTITYPNGVKITPGNPISLHGTWLFIEGDNSWGVKIHNDIVGQKDPFNNKHQWRALSFGYTSEDPIPGFDIGKRWNVAGSKLSYTTFSLKLFEIFRIQLAISEKKVNIGGTPVPVSLAGGTSVGFDF